MVGADQHFSPGDLVYLDEASRAGEPALIPLSGLCRDASMVGIVVHSMAALVGLTLVEVLWSDGSCHSCSTNVLHRLGPGHACTLKR